MSEVLVHVERGPLVESMHRGDIVIVNSAGEVIRQLGDIEKIVYARSSMKPLQAIPLVESGAASHYSFDDGDLALACASHNGESQHTNRVTSILSRLEMDNGSLKCGTHPPRRQEAFREVLEKQLEITPIYNNCSGKHCGMLATAKYFGESLEDYYKPGHPVQRRILTVISEMSDVPEDDIEIGIDGCGVPVHGIPLKNLALAFARMADPVHMGEKRKNAIQRITKAMTSACEMVGGTERFCTDFMKQMEGKAFGKAGAEGVYCVGIPEKGLGIAVKIEDGNGRATSAVVLEAMEQLNLLSSRNLKELEEYHRPPLRNARNEKIGVLRPVFAIE